MAQVNPWDADFETASQANPWDAEFATAGTAVMNHPAPTQRQQPPQPHGRTNQQPPAAPVQQQPPAVHQPVEQLTEFPLANGGKATRREDGFYDVLDAKGKPSGVRYQRTEEGFQPHSRQVEHDGGLANFPHYVSDETIQGHLKRDLARKGKLKLEGSRSQWYDAEDHVKQRQTTPIDEVARKEYAEFFSGKDAEGKAVTVKPEEITPQALESVVQQRKAWAESSEGLAAKEANPFAYEQFTQETAAIERDSGREFDNETSTERHARQLVRMPDSEVMAQAEHDGLKDAKTPEKARQQLYEAYVASLPEDQVVADEKIIKARPGYVAREDQPWDVRWAESLLREYHAKGKVPHWKEALFEYANTKYSKWLKEHPDAADRDFDAWRGQDLSTVLVDKADKRKDDASLSEAMVGRHAYVTDKGGGSTTTPYTLKRIPFGGAAVTAAEMVQLRNAVKAVKAGKATESHWFTIARFVDEAERNKDRGFKMKVWDTVSHLPAFGVELAMTGGMFTAGRYAARKAGATVLSRALLNQSLKAGAKAATSTAFRRGAIWTAGKASEAAIGVGALTAANPQLVAQEVATQWVPEWDIVSKNDELSVAITKDKSFAEAFIKGTGSAYIEVGTEVAVGKGLGGLFGVMGKSRAARALSQLPPARAATGLKRAVVNRLLAKGVDPARIKASMNKAGWHGLIEESLEERVADVARGATGIEEDYGTTGRVLAGDPEGFEQLLVEGLAFAAMPVMATASVAVERATTPQSERYKERVAGLRAKLDAGGTVSREDAAAVKAVLDIDLPTEQAERTALMRDIYSAQGEVETRQLEKEIQDAEVRNEEVRGETEGTEQAADPTQDEVSSAIAEELARRRKSPPGKTVTTPKLEMTTGGPPTQAETELRNRQPTTKPTADIELTEDDIADDIASAKAMAREEYDDELILRERLPYDEAVRLGGDNAQGESTDAPTLQGEVVDDGDQFIERDGKRLRVTVTGVNEDDGWRVKGVKLHDDSTGSYEPVPFPDDANLRFGSYDQAKQAVLDSIQPPKQISQEQPKIGVAKPVAEEPPTVTPWAAETQQRLAAVPAFQNAQIDLDETTGTARVTRPDGRTTTVHLNEDEKLAKLAKKRGVKGAKGAYVYRTGKKGKFQEGDIYIRSDAGHDTLNHEAIHWLEDEGVITPEEVAQHGGREGIAKAYAEWVTGKQRKPDTLLQRIYDFIEPLLSSRTRLFEDIGKRGQNPPAKRKAITAKNPKRGVKEGEDVSPQAIAETQELSRDTPLTPKQRVTLTIAGPQGPMKVGGRIDRIRDDGQVEVRTQLHGIHTVDPSTVTPVTQPNTQGPPPSAPEAQAAPPRRKPTITRGQQPSPPTPRTINVPKRGIGRKKETTQRSPQDQEEFLRDVIAVMYGQESPGFSQDQEAVAAESSRRLGKAKKGTKAYRKAISDAEAAWQAAKSEAVQAATATGPQATGAAARMSESIERYKQSYRDRFTIRTESGEGLTEFGPTKVIGRDVSTPTPEFAAPMARAYTEGIDDSKNRYSARKSFTVGDEQFYALRDRRGGLWHIYPGKPKFDPVEQPVFQVSNADLPTGSTTVSRIESNPQEPNANPPPPTTTPEATPKAKRKSQAQTVAEPGGVDAGDGGGDQGAVVTDDIPSNVGDVYRINFKGQQKYSVREFEHPRGLGDAFFSTADEAQAYAERVRQRKSDEAAREAKNLSEKAAADAERAAKDDIDGFASDKPDVQRQRIISTLNKNVNVRGRVMTRKQRIKDAISRGATIRTENGEDRIYLNDGRVQRSDGTFNEGVEYFLDATKTEVGYAKYLINRAAETAPTEPAILPASEEVTSGQETSSRPDPASPAKTSSEAPGAGNRSRSAPAEGPGARGRNLASHATPGKASTLALAGGKSKPIRYFVVEDDGITPSHDARAGFRQNPDGDKNERPYHDPKEGASSRAMVEDISKADLAKLDLLTSDTLSATDGPPIVNAQGVVMGGNARSMGIQLAYHRGGESAARMKQAMVAAAKKFGLDPDAIAKMQRPIIVREVADAGERGEMSAILNEPLTAGKSRATIAASRGDRVSENTAAMLSAMMAPDDNGDVPSVRSVLASAANSRRILESLQRDGVFADRELDQYVDPDGSFNDAGKSAVEEMLLGKVVGNPSIIGDMAPSVRNKVLSAIGPIVRGMGDKKHGKRYTQVIRDAIESIPSWQASDLPATQYYLEQKSLLEDAPGVGDEAVAIMADQMWQLGPVKFRAAIKEINDAIGVESGTKQTSLFGGEMRTDNIDDAIREQFGRLLPAAVADELANRTPQKATTEHVGVPVGPQVNRRFKVERFGDEYHVFSALSPNEPTVFDSEQAALEESERLNKESLAATTWKEWDSQIEKAMRGMAAESPKKKRSERKAEEAEAKKKVLQEKLRKLADPTQLNIGLDPKKVIEAVDAALAAIDYGITRFDQYVSAVVESIGEARTRELSRYLEEAARQTGIEGVTSIGEVLSKEAAPVTREQRIQEIQDTFRVPKKVAEVAVALHDMTGIGTDRIQVAKPDAAIPKGTLKQAQREGDSIKGWTHFINAAKAIVGGTDKADISTWIHEFAHPMRRFLFDRSVPAEQRAGITDEDIQVIEEWAGAKNGKWNRAAEEKFAQGWETYWMEGKAPSAELEMIFQKIARWMGEVYGQLKSLVKLTPEVRAVFDKVVQRGSDRTGPRVAVERKPQAPYPDRQVERGPYTDHELTGMAKAVMNDLRELGKVPELEAAPPETIEQWARDAQTTMAADPHAPSRLLNEIVANPARALDHHDVMLLAFRYRELANQAEPHFQELVDASASGDAARIAQARTNFINARQPMTEFEELTLKAKSTWGRTGIALQVMLRKDNSVAGLMRRARQENHGQPLSPEQEMEMRDLAKRFAEVQKKLDAETARADKAEAEVAALKHLRKVVKESPTRKKPSQAQKSALAKAWDKIAKIANVELLFQSASNPYSEAVQVYRDLGVSTFAELRRHIQERLGEKQAAALEDQFRQAWEATKPETEVDADIDMGDLAQLTREARKIERSIVEGLLLDHSADAVLEMRDKIIDDVHEEMRGLVGDSFTRRQTMDALSAYGQFSRPSQDTTDTLLRNLNAEVLKLRQIDQLGDAITRTEKLRAEGKADAEIGDILIKEGLLVQPTGPQRDTPTDRLRALNRQYTELKKDIPASSEGRAGLLQTAVAAIERGLANRIRDLNYAIAHQQPIKIGGKASPTNETIEQMKAERDALLKQYREMFPPERKKLTPEQRLANAIKAAERSIAVIEKQLKTRNFDKAAAEALPDSPERMALKQRLEQLRAQREAAKALELAAWEGEGGSVAPDPKEAAYRKAYIASLRNRIAKLQQFIREGDFAPKEKPQPRKLSPQELSLKKKLAELNVEKLEKMAAYHLAHLKGVPWVADKASEVLHLARAIETAFDISALGRQGGLITLGHPVLAKRALQGVVASMAKSFDKSAAFNTQDFKWSELEKFLTGIDSRQAELEFMHQLTEGEWGEFRQHAGLDLPSTDQAITRQEEVFQGRWGKFVPGVGVSSRLYTMILNKMRADMFDLMVEKLGRQGRPTLDEAKLIANFVNVMTGRSDAIIWNGRDVTAMLNLAIFAPRYVASRFQYIAMPFYLPFKGGVKSNWQIKRAIYKEYARTASGAALVLGFVALAAQLFWDDDDDEKPTIDLDSTSPDFLKVKIGETRLDFLAGLQQIFVYSSRMVTGRVGDREFGEGGPYAQNRATITARFLRTKLAPGPGYAVTALNDWENVVGQKSDRLFGAEVHPAIGTTAELFMPLSVRDIGETFKTQAVPVAAGASILSILGIGMSTYGPKTQYMVGTAEDREKQFATDLENMQWDSPDPAYAEFLSSDQMEQVRARREERKQSVVTSALVSAETDKSKEELEAAKQRLRNTGWSHYEAQQHLFNHYNGRPGMNWDKFYALAEFYGLERDAAFDEIKGPDRDYDTEFGRWMATQDARWKQERAAKRKKN